MDVFDLFAKLTLDDSEYRSGLRGAQSMASSAGSAIGGALSTGLKVATAALGAATTAVTGFAASSVKVGEGFDKAMSQVAATMGKTVSEIGELRTFAQDMGAKTAFSATQAAEALNYMALAGYDSATSMKMLPNVLNLAAAGDMDLARASDMVTDTQTAFGISLQRTSQMVDEMAKAASTGNTSVEQLGDAFLVVGGLAQELNGGMVTLSDGTTQTYDNIQELEIALTAMANAGIKGSEAGTHMRNMLLKLADPTDAGVKQFERLGVSVFDDEGKMRSLAGIMEDLAGELDNLTQEEKLQAISDIFNTRDTAAAESLLNAIGEDWSSIAESILDAEGAAEQMAHTQLDNLAGDITLFKSALEGVQITLSDSLTSPLREFVRIGTEGLGHIKTLLTEFDATPYLDEMGRMSQEGAMAQAQLKKDKEAAMQGMFDTLTAGLDMIIDMIPDLLDAGAKVLGALVKGITDNIDSIIDAAGEIFDSLMQGMLQASEGGTGIGEVIDKIVSAFMNGLGRFFETGTQILLNIAHGITDSMPNMVGVAADIIAQFCQFVIDSAPDLISAGVDIILSLATGIGDSLPELVPMAVEAILTVVQGLVDNVDKVIDAALAIIEGLATGLLNALPVLIEKAPEIIVALVKGMLESLPKIFDLGINIITELVRSLIENAPKMVEAAFEIITSLAIGAINAYAELDRAGRELIDKLRETIFSFDFISWGADMINGIVNGIKSGIGSLGDAAKEAAGNIAKFLHFSVPDEGPLADADTYGPDLIELLASGIENNVGSLADRIRVALDIVKAVFNEFFDGIRISFEESAFRMTENVTALLVKITEAVGKAIEEWRGKLQEFNEWLNLTIEELKNLVASQFGAEEGAIFTQILTSLDAFVVAVQTKITEMSATMQASVADMLAVVSNQVITFFATLSPVVTTNLQTIHTQVTTFATELRNTITRLFEDGSGLLGVIKSFFTKVTDEMQKKLALIKNNLQTFKQTVTQLVKEMLNGGSGIYEITKKFFENTLKLNKKKLIEGNGSVKGIVIQLVEWMNPYLEEQLASIYDIVNEHLSEVRKKVKKIAKKIEEIITEIVDKAYEWGEHLGANFAEGIASQAEAVAAAAASLAEAAAAYLEHTVPKKGPLHNDDKWGGHLVMNFVNGIKRGLPEAEKVMLLLGGAVVNGFKDGTNSLPDAAKEILEKTKEVSVNVGNEINKAILRLQEKLAIDELKQNETLSDQKKQKYKEKLHDLYTALGTAEGEEIEAVQAKILALKEKWQDKEQVSTEEAVKNVVDAQIQALETLKSEYDAALQEIDSKVKSFTDKMTAYGNLFTKVTDETTGVEAFQLGDLTNDINTLKNYGAALDEVRARSIPDGLMAEILNMSIDDAMGYMNELKKMTDDEYKAYADAWVEKQRIAAEIANKFYQSEYDAVKDNFMNKTLKAMSTMEGQLNKIGKNAVKGMEEGMNSKLPSLLKAARKIANNVISEMKDAMGIASPSKEMRDQVGIWITRGLADGMESGMPYLNNATDSLMQTILGVGEGVGDTFIDGLVSGIREGGEYLKDAVSDIDGMMSANIISDTNGRQAIGGYTQIINNYSPEALDASEIARQTRNATQNMVLRLRMA